MATKFEIGNIVSYALGDIPEYKVMATTLQPHKREFGVDVEVQDGFAYLIIQHPVPAGFHDFIPVYENSLTLIRDK